MHSTRAAVEEGWCPAEGVALVRALGKLKGLEGENEDQNVGISIARRAMHEPLRQIVANAGGEAVGGAEQGGGREGQLRVQRADRGVWGLGEDGDPGPDEGGAHGVTERGVDCGVADHDGGDGGGEAEEGR